MQLQSENLEVNPITELRLILRLVSPFFTVLAFQLSFIETSDPNVIAFTDGQRIVYNPAYFNRFSKRERVGVFIHEILHVVLSHCLRRGLREHKRWNLACFKADAPILTKSGYLPISDITPCMQVLTKEGKYERVTATMTKYYSGQMVTFKAQGNLPVEATADHKFWVRQSLVSTNDLGEPKWVEAVNLKVGDYVHIPNQQVDRKTTVQLGYFLPNGVALDSDLGKETAWGLGRYLCGGSVKDDFTVEWSVDKNNPQEAERLVAWLNKLGYDRVNRSSFKVTLNSKEFRQFVQCYFEATAGRQIPSFMYAQEADLIKSFIEGWQRCKDEIQGRTSYAMALGLQRLAVTAGLDCRLRPFEDGCYVDLYKTDRQAEQIKEGLWTRIDAVDSQEFVGNVYTLTVENSHSYTVWNTSCANCDIMINEMIADLSYCDLPEGTVREPSLWRESCEEIYELLEDRQDLMDKFFQSSLQNDLRPELAKGKELSQEEAQKLQEKFKGMLQEANDEQSKKNTTYGSLGSKLERVLAELTQPQIDWRSVLRDYLVKFPCDYEGFDRRWIGTEVYTEGFEGTKVSVAVCIDTSGSIGAEELGTFASELAGVLNAYSQVECLLYWADADLYGPYEISNINSMPNPEGGGGTSFIPFFEALENLTDPLSAAIYLTDGYGNFPSKPSEIPTLWVVTKDGLDSKSFPFGTVVRLDK